MSGSLAVVGGVCHNERASTWSPAPPEQAQRGSPATLYRTDAVPGSLARGALRATTGRRARDDSASSKATCHG